MANLDRSGIERAEQEWRSRGLRVFSAVLMMTLGAYSAANLASGNFAAAAATAIGLPVVALTYVVAGRDPTPRWAAVPLTLYLLLMLGGLLAIEHADSAVVMFLAAGPAVAIFGFGARLGGALSAVLLVMMLATFEFNDHQLPLAYETRFIVAFVLSGVVGFIYERMRTDSIQRLTAAVERIETLEKMLPMCAWCGKVDVEDEAGNDQWVPIEEYLADQDQQVTHGLCPDCYDREMKRVDQQLI